MTEINNSFEIISIKRIPAQDMGALQFFEGIHDIPFEIKRIYYITEVPKNIWRGGHAHKTLKQIIFCPYGNVILRLSDGITTIDIELDRPDKGVIITRPLWRDMLWRKEGSVLCVAASDFYNENDYIRNRKEFIKYMEDR